MTLQPDPEPWQDAAVSADHRWRLLCQARTPLDHAGLLILLSNAMSDLRSFLPGYDVDSDTMPWERDDDL